MGGREIEPRKTVWALAEVCWQEPDGTPLRAPATLEDTSASGACVRVKRAFAVGSRLTIKWRREEFTATAKNCRNDGRDFLLGVRREPEARREEPPQAPSNGTPSSYSNSIDINNIPENPAALMPRPNTTAPSQPEVPASRVNRPPSFSAEEQQLRRPDTSQPIPVAKSPPERMRAAFDDTHSHSERKVMQPKSLIPQFWRREKVPGAPATSVSTEVPVNKPSTHITEANSGRRSELLSYEDIYRAAGIMSPGSKYDIHKVVDMLNSERIRDLSKEAKRASVLMALDAAGTSADDLLTEATRRQNALNSYETAQRKQLEDFEALKSQQNARIEEEMEKIRAHYGERIQKNLDLVAKEKEALRNWQSAMQHESQRIADVIELCGKPSAASQTPMIAAASAASGGKSVMGGEKPQLPKP